MIVYGDPLYALTAGEGLARLRTNLSVCAAQLAPASLRSLLIRAGELEQAVADALPADMAPVAALTDAAADALLGAEQQSHPATALAQVAGALAGIRLPTDTPLTVKVPEGFAFYALYPEQYTFAAQRWLREHGNAHPQRAIVVGVRSIGTTLSAVVAATLRAGGWQIRRLTVRPTGHPYERVVETPLAVGDAAWGLVVDEGPGHSGSSMVAVAEALHRAGLPRERIAFFPGHGGEPGPAASDAVRGWWRRVPRYPASEHVALPMPGALMTATERLTGKRVVAVEDVGGGAWRQVVYDELATWPPAFVLFEAPKLLLTLADGARVLWKFAGLASAPGVGGSLAEAALQRLRARAAWAEEGLGTVHGWLALRWVEGTPLTSSQDAEVLAHVGRYVAAVAGPPLPPGERAAAWERLREMVRWNVWEALGEAQATHACARADEAAPYALAEVPHYGDGRLAPWAWRRTPAGQLVKVDGAGHEVDHTVVGAQPVAWDVAGALVEWELDNVRAAPLLKAYEQAGGAAIPREVLHVYRLAYAAFRAGQCSLCAQGTGDAAEQARLWAAFGRYRVEVERILGEW